MKRFFFLPHLLSAICVVTSAYGHDEEEKQEDYKIENLSGITDDLGAGWRGHPTFGDYYQSSENQWIHHEVHGWIYVWPLADGNIWWWSPGHGYFYTGLFGTYPWVYSYRFDGWLYRHKEGTDSTDGRRLFYAPDLEKTAPIDDLLPPRALEDKDFRPLQPAEKIELGRRLFEDVALSGNRNISCVTCHSTAQGGGDGLPVSIGEGGTGEGGSRLALGGARRMARNAPSLLNAVFVDRLSYFHDGSVNADETQPSGFHSPAGQTLPDDLESGLAVVTMVHVADSIAMAGEDGENEIAGVAREKRLSGAGGVWELLANRLMEDEEYLPYFEASFPEEISIASDIRFSHAANALAAYMESAFRPAVSPYDSSHLGSGTGLSDEAKEGMHLFFGKARCSECHSGVHFSDGDFHAIAMPQVGPGTGRGDGGSEDFGRENVTGLTSERYQFLTPSLRNVASSGPWGHDGAFLTLEEVVRHHLDPVQSLRSYTGSRLQIPAAQGIPNRDAIASRNELEAVVLSDEEINELLLFLNTLDANGPGGVVSGAAQLPDRLRATENSELPASEEDPIVEESDPTDDR